MKASDVIEAVQKFAEPELVAFVDGLNPALALVPLDALLRLADAVAKMIEAKNELAAMRAAVQAADASVDAAEADALKVAK